ncbi:CCAAT-binding factor [Penicillium bovifimosum]|uniref:CCAAT-binding factor n=1 Tax=Penicillium bovifimosum TaxID=126998 RepID=A0A9W9H181_9EURO|nr:CCAAT-binding factor [Penicillium bovifimosum]KAJ5135754.1 CCAAT-binding factor [Penicillium bovifimosum]
MAKGKGKGSSGTTENAPTTSVSAPAAETTVAMPDESAFAGLRQKIEQRLKNQNQNAGKGKKDNTKPAPNNKPTPNAKSAPTPDFSSKKGKQSPAKPARAQDSAQGKKRDRNGEVITREEKKGESNKPGKPKGSKKSNADETLRQEILAMGGTEEDLDLLADVDSESEVEGESGNADDDLRKQLSSMLEAAGHVVPEDLADDEVEEVEAQPESDVDDVDVEESEDDAESSGPESDIEEAPQKTKEQQGVVPKEYAKLNVLPRSDWYNIPMPSVPDTKQMNALPRHLMERVHELANKLLEEESEEYAAAQRASASSSHKFYSTIMASGTLSDKISALTLNVQESPLHNTKALESLIALGKKRSRAQAVEVLRSLKDMFAQGTLLPSDRRLKSFTNQPGLVAAFQGAGGRWNVKDPLPGGLKKSELIIWAFESFLKDQYFEVIKILEIWCNDEIEFSRSRAVSYVYELLKEKPEQETNLLRLLVNKLGDPGKKIASRASYLLLQLMQSHPMMKPIIIKSVEEILFRPGQSSHAKYYAVITLNQTILRQKEEKVATQLLDIYFGLFLVLLKPTQKGKPAPKYKQNKRGKGSKGKDDDDAAKGQAQDDEMREKLISGVLTGVNRAYPFTDSDSERMSKHLDTLFRITHSSNFNTSIQALMLIQQLTVSNKVSGDRFYRTLYESLLDPRVATSSKQSLYLNLLYKSLKNDLNVRRVKAFVKRLVQVLNMHQPSFICGVFFMIRELEKTFTGLSALVDQPEENDDDDEEVFRDVLDEDDEQPEPAPVAEVKKQNNVYDPRKRDPEHSNADRSCLWELLPFTSHFHPSVSLNAANLLEHKPMSGKPDLTLHTLTHFLDRFVYRTPKASAATRGASIMQPLAGGEVADRLVEAGKKAQNQLPLNTEAFWKKKADDVAAEDVFFHEYFTRVNKDKANVRGKKAKAADGSDDEGLSDNEDEIWKALVDSRPELEADEDSDDDMDMSDLESAMDEDEDDEDESDGGVIFNDDSDVPSGEDEEMAELSEAEEAVPSAKTKKAAKKPTKEDEEDSDDFDMDVSDDEAFIDSDEDLPSDIELGGVELEEPVETAVPAESDRKKRRKLKQLPTFASAEDYAALLADEDEGM